MLNPNIIKNPIIKPNTITYKIIGGKKYKCKSFRSYNNTSRWKVLVSCPICNIDSWINETTIKKGFTMCKKCNNERFRTSGKNHLGYVNGITRKSNGYVDILLDKNDPLLCMSTTTGNYVAEHRYLMAKKIGRPLKESEHVHHLNGIKDDNRIENLCLLDGSIHIIVTKLEQKIKRLEKRIEELELC